MTGRVKINVSLPVRLPKPMMMELDRIVKDKNYATRTDAVHEAIRDFIKKHQETKP